MFNVMLGIRLQPERKKSISEITVLERCEPTLVLAALKLRLRLA